MTELYHSPFLYGTGIALLFTLFCSWIINKFNHNFTREVYFVIWLTSLLCLCILSIGLLYDAQLFTSTFTFLTPESELPDGTAAGWLFLLLLWFMLIASLHAIYFSWDGLKSKLQHLEEIGDRRVDFRVTIRALFTRDKNLKAWRGLVDDPITPIHFSKEQIEKDWHIHAIELLQYINPELQIHSTEIDNYQNSNVIWHPEQNCYLTELENTKTTVGILCIKEEPSIIPLEQFQQFIASQNPSHNSLKLLVLIEAFNNKKSGTINIVGPIQFRYKEEMIGCFNSYFSIYRNYIINKYEEQVVDINSEMAIQDFYVEPSTTLFSRKPNTDNKKEEENIEHTEKYISNWLQNSNDKTQLALLGEYGQGKSVLSLRIAYKLFKQENFPKYIPIIYELRGSSPQQHRNKLEFMATWAVNFNIPTRVLLKLHELGRLLIIFEGFDEMEMVGNYATRVGHFQKLWSFANSKSKMIITGRPNYFLNDNELTTLLRSHRQSPNLPYCEELHLNMFDLNQIEQSLRYKSDNQRNDIMELLKNSPEKSGFRDLMKRPALLSIAGSIWGKEDLTAIGANINSAYVMERFLEYSYKRQYLKLGYANSSKKATSHSPILEISERAYFMMGIAISMASENSFSNQIKRDHLNDIVLRLIESFNPLISQLSPIRYHHSSFSERTSVFEAKKKVIRDVIACGILVRDFSGENLFKFAHKSFFEFLVSRFYVSLLLKKEKSNLHFEMANTISSALRIDILDISHTMDTGKFTGELLLNEANITTTDAKIKARKLFQFIYPIKILDRFPEIAFPTFKSFLIGIIIGMLLIIFSSILALLIHPYIQYVTGSLIAILFVLFGIRIWFRMGLFLGAMIPGIISISAILKWAGFTAPVELDKLFFFINIEDENSGESIEDYISIAVIMIIALLVSKFFLIKTRNASPMDLIAIENSKIDKILQLWVISCDGLAIPEKYLLKFMSRRKLKKLRTIKSNK